MNAAEWRRAKDVITAALARSPRERAAFLDQACPDPATREEIAALIDRCASSPHLLDSPEQPIVLEPADAPTATGVLAGFDFAQHQKIGPYVFEAPLGKGGMGEVYLAQDTRLHRRVAIKVLSGGRGDQSEVRRLMREAGAAAQLNDPRIAAVYDVLEVDDRAFIVMEYVPGQTLSQHARSRALGPEETVRIGIEIAMALAHAHHAGIVHCDLKPANIKLTPNGAVKILDFGLARQSPRADGVAASPRSLDSAVQVVAGTPGYMSPEQVLGRTLDARTDIYSLGVILFELATGARPFQGRDMISLALAVMTQPTPALPKILPAPLRQVIECCLEKEAAARYQSAGAVADALSGIVTAAGTVSVVIPSTPRRGQAARAAAALALIGALAGGIWWRVAHQRSSTPAVVAILPFTAGDHKTSTPIATGLADILAADLSGVPGFVLIPRTASLKFSADPATYHVVADELGADHAITGLIDEAGSAINATVSLVGLRDGAVVWSRSFQGQRDDVVSLEQRIAEAAIAQLRGGRPGAAGSGDTSSTRAPRPTLDRLAFEDYSQGRTFLDRSDDAANTARALKLFESAVARDKHFALAFAAIGEACTRQYELTHDAALADRARDATLEALRLDPSQPMVRFALASTYRATGKRDEAIEEINRAITLQPSNDEFHRMLGLMYGEMHRTDDAIAELSVAKSLRPGFWNSYRALGLVYFQAGRYDEAIAALKRATELQPDSNSGFQMLGTAYHASGDFEHALVSYNQANAIKPNPRAWSNIGMIRHRQGKYGEAVTAYQKSIELSPREAATFRNLGDAYARVPDAANARVAYQQALELTKAQLTVNPRSSTLVALEALCEAKLGHLDEATRLAKHAVDLAPESGDALFKQAAVETIAGHGDLAAAALRAALDHGYSREIARDDEDLASLRRRPDVASWLTASK